MCDHLLQCAAGLLERAVKAEGSCAGVNVFFCKVCQIGEKFVGWDEMQR